MLKVLGILLVVLVVLIGTMFAWFVSRNNRPAGSNPVQLGEDDFETKRALVVFQPSQSGIADRTAYAIAEGLLENGFFVLMEYPGEHLASDTREYAVVVFGSPVYVGRPSEVLLAYMERALFMDQQEVYLFSTGSVNDAPEWESMEKMLDGKVTVMGKRKFFTDQEEALLLDARQFGQRMGEASE